MKKLHLKVIQDIKSEFPSFEVIDKRSSNFMKFINIILKILSFGMNKSFMEAYTTTIRYKLYTPEDWETYSDITRAVVLRHELVHMRQSKKLTFPIFTFLYIFFPLPMFVAYSRAKFEMEAYKESIRASAEYKGVEYIKSQHFQDHLVEQFTKAQYLYMFPFKKTVTKWVVDAVEETAKEIGVAK